MELARTTRGRIRRSAVVFGSVAALAAGSAAMSLGTWSTTSYGGACGKGYIVGISAGGWNTDHLLINLDAVVPASGTLDYTNHVRFGPGITSDRLKQIRTLAYMAMANQMPVTMHAASGDCSQASELTVLRRGAPLN